MRFLIRSLTGLLLLAVTAALLAWAGQIVLSTVSERLAREAPPRPARERVYAVGVITAEPSTVSPVITAFGEVRARRSLDLRAATGGEIIELADGFEDGGAVKAGELLIRIDPADARTALDVARADLREAMDEREDAGRTVALRRDELAAAENQARLQDRALARQRDLLTRRVGTEAAVDAAELAASSAEQTVLARRQALADAEARQSQSGTGVARAEIRLAEAQRRFDDTTLRAAFDGVLTEVTAELGRLVGQNEKLATLIDPTELEIAFRLSTPQYVRLLDDAGAIRLRPITARLDFLDVGLTAQGMITRDSAAVAEGQTGRLAFARLEAGRAAGFRPGDFVTVEIEEPPLDDVIVLPAAAVDAAGRVLVLGEGDRLEDRAVEVLRTMDDRVLVRGDGLEGAQVVAERTPLVGAGIKVRPVRRDAETGAVTTAEPEMVTLSAADRARLVALVEANTRMPAEARERVLGQLNAERVPREMIERLEQRRGGG